jgi:hypothetical protein
MLNIVWYLIIGFISRWIAKVIMRVPDVKWWEILILGIVGSIVGGLIARLWSKPRDGRPVPPGRASDVNRRSNRSLRYWQNGTPLGLTPTVSNGTP